jgi:hypothetical protein
MQITPATVQASLALPGSRSIPAMHKYCIDGRVDVLGHLVVTVLVIGPKVRGIKPGPGRCIFSRVIEIRRTTSFGGEVKPSAPCRKILRHVKDPCGVWEKYFTSKINAKISSSFSLICYYVSLLLFSMNQERSEIRWGRTTDQKMVAVNGDALYDTTP